MEKTITIQYEITTSRRGQMTTKVAERSFPNEAALERWAEKNADNVTILRYEVGR